VRDAGLLVLQIEGREGVAQAEEIAATPGIDGVFVGPYDLSHALGEPGAVNGAAIVDAARRVAEATPAGVMLGMYVDDPADSALWAERGYRLQCLSFDGRMLLERARGVVAIADAGITDGRRIT
jgi:2-keto-3-deoxy-L-rhamnonate aldolase RhmA